MTKKIVSLLTTTCLLVFMLVPASYANPYKWYWQLNPENYQVGTQNTQNDDSVTQQVDGNPGPGKHKGVLNALTHVKNPLARAVLQAILDGKSVADAVYQYDNEMSGSSDTGDLDSVTEEVYNNLSGSKLDKALTYKYLGQMHIKAGKFTDALGLMNLAALNNCLDTDTFKELDGIYANNKNFNVKVYINGSDTSFDVPPRISNGRTMVPVRFVAESLHAKVAYDASTGTVTIQGQVTIKMKINSKIAYVNGQQVELDVPATLDSGRTMVPLRFIGEGFKCKVNYYGQSNLVSITS